MFNLQVINKSELSSNKLEIVEHFLKLSTEQLCLRFFKNMSREGLEHWIDQSSKCNHYEHLWFLAKINEKIIGICQLTYDRHGMAELAFSVIDQFQQKGIAKFLMSTAINRAKNDLSTQIKHIMLTFKYNNMSVRKLIKQHQFDLSIQQDEIIATLSI